MINKFITSTFSINDNNIYVTNTDFIDNDKPLKVISYIGCQSTGKSTGTNHTWNTVFPTGDNKTTNLCDYNISLKNGTQYCILDVEGYMSPDNQLQFLELFDNYDDKFDLAHNMNKKISLKLGTFIWTISDVVIYYLKSSELQSSYMFDFLMNLQKNNYIKEANDPFVFFICINDSNNKLTDIMLYDRLVFLIKKFSIVRKYDVIITPYYNNNIDQQIYEQKMVDLYNTIINMENGLSQNVKFWKESVNEIINCINNDLNLMSIIKRENLWCEKMSSYILDKFCKLLDDHVKCKLLDTNNIINNMISKFDKKSVGKSKESYKNQLYVLLCEKNNIYINKYKKCVVMCGKNIHECIISGVHDVHKFAVNDVTIKCPHGCGFTKLVSCDSIDDEIVCENDKMVYCGTGCGTIKKLKCFEGNNWVCNYTEPKLCLECEVVIGVNNCKSKGVYGMCNKPINTTCFECLEPLVVNCGLGRNPRHSYNCRVNIPTDCVLCTGSTNWISKRTKCETVQNFSCKRVTRGLWHIGPTCPRATGDPSINGGPNGYNPKHSHYQCCGQSVFTKGCTNSVQYHF